MWLFLHRIANDYLLLWVMSQQLLLHSYLSAYNISTTPTGSMAELLNASIQIEQQRNAGDEMAKETRISDKSTIPEAFTTKNATSYRGSSLRAWIVCWMLLVPMFLFWWFWFRLTYGWPGLSVADIHRREVSNNRLPFTYNYGMANCWQ